MFVESRHGRTIGHDPSPLRLLLSEQAKSRKQAKRKEIEAIRLITSAPQGAHRFAFKFIIRSRPRFLSNVSGKSTYSTTLGSFTPRDDSSNLRPPPRAKDLQIAANSAPSRGGKEYLEVRYKIRNE